jgi:hypothetical protein
MTFMPWGFFLRVSSIREIMTLLETILKIQLACPDIINQSFFVRMQFPGREPNRRPGRWESDQKYIFPILSSRFLFSEVHVRLIKTIWEKMMKMLWMTATDS